LKFAAGNGAYRETGFDQNNSLPLKNTNKSIKVEYLDD
jgi:hypothetical protein